MRTSVRVSDPGYKNFVPGKWAIFLDGEPVRLCVTADEEEGYILCFAPGPDGKPYLNESQTAAVERELRGKVEVRIDGGWALKNPDKL